MKAIVGSFLLLGAAAQALSAPDRHAMTVAAIAEGDAAIAQRDARRLADAERLLSASGARPLDAGADLVGSWRREANVRGLAPPPPAPPTRGRVLGSAYKQALLQPNGSMAIEQTYLAGQKAQVSVVPSRQAEVTVAVVDMDGKTVCRREAAARPASCSWMPLWTTRYRIELRNPTPRPAAAYLVID